MRLLKIKSGINSYVCVAESIIVHIYVYNHNTKKCNERDLKTISYDMVAVNRPCVGKFYMSEAQEGSDQLGCLHMFKNMVISGLIFAASQKR